MTPYSKKKTLNLLHGEYHAEKALRQIMRPYLRNG
jgi:hypothetical protein